VAGVSIRSKGLRLFWVVLALSQAFLLTTGLTKAADSPTAGYSFANGAFRHNWERADLPVIQQVTSRSFIWGPVGWAFRQEAYVETPGASRSVQYFDKARMEITHPEGNPNDTFYVTNGLLVREMVSGLIQDGDNHFVPYHISEQPVAGDLNDTLGPTYKTFSSLASLNVNNRAKDRTGGTITTFISRNGELTETSQFGDAVKYAQYSPELGHNIPNVFWDFMNQTGPVYQGGQILIDPVVNWVTTMGLPITEPYWTSASVNGQPKALMVQLFERRVLTYTPSNPDNFKVEMGNVGTQYYNWRYPADYPPSAPWANVTIANGSDCDTVQVVLSGQDDITIGLKAKAQRLLNLAPGSYSYYVTGCGYIPSQFTKSYLPNAQYKEQVLVIKPGSS
jgi:hypothetical protein